MDVWMEGEVFGSEGEWWMWMGAGIADEEAQRKDWRAGWTDEMGFWW